MLEQIRDGMVIPAMPLALDAQRRFAEKVQRRLTRYYLEAGAGGVAVGVHTTQFSIRDPGVDLFKPVLRSVSRAVDEWCEKNSKKVFKVAGICGRTSQARQEAIFANQEGFHAGLLSLSAFPSDDLDTILNHCREIADHIPLVGFYLQPAVGGRVLSYDFWRKFAEIENVVAIKIAPFNRYQTLDVIRGVCDAGRSNEIALYTGNDDNIIIDLLTKYHVKTNGGVNEVQIVGGLLGHWAIWTRKAVELLKTIKKIKKSGLDIPENLLTLAAQVTDANSVVFDAANQFAGCIPGIHYVLYKQGLLPGLWCLDENETLSPGQKDEIERVTAAYPDQTDDEFVRAFLSTETV